MRTICIIPARGGSKRIPLKNVKPMLGIPIIARAIAIARSAECFDEVFVSTDDSEIAAIARDHGASVPFLRSPETSGDFATPSSVVGEVLTRLADTGHTYSLGCCLYPTSALLRPERLGEGRDALLKHPAAETAASVLVFSHPIQRALRIREGLLEWVDIEAASRRTQDLEPHYHDAGQFYWFKVPVFMQKRTLLRGVVAPVPLSPLEAWDIDTEEDWKTVETLLLARAEEGNHAR